MTLADIAKMDKPCLTPAEAAAVLRWDAQYIRVTARLEPKALPWPVYRKGHRTYIPRLPFLAAYGVGVKSRDGGD